MPLHCFSVWLKGISFGYTYRSNICTWPIDRLYSHILSAMSRPMYCVKNPRGIHKAELWKHAVTCRTDDRIAKKGAVTFWTMVIISGPVQKKEGLENAFDFPWFCTGVYPPVVLWRQGPSAGLHWVVILQISLLRMNSSWTCSPDNKGMLRWMKMAKERSHSRDYLHASAGWGAGEREKAGLAFNELVNRER